MTVNVQLAMMLSNIAADVRLRPLTSVASRVNASSVAADHGGVATGPIATRQIISLAGVVGSPGGRRATSTACSRSIVARRAAGIETVVRATARAPS